VRENPPDAIAAKITLIARQYQGVTRGGGAEFPESSRSNLKNSHFLNRTFPAPVSDVSTAVTFLQRQFAKQSTVH